VTRRFIADFVPVKDRTVASAHFVTSGAMGMAFGPLLASLLTDVDFKMGMVSVNRFTAPGFSSFILN